MRLDRVAARMQAVVDTEARALADRCVRDGRIAMELLDRHQESGYRLAFLAAESAAIGALAPYAVLGETEDLLARVAAADLIRSARARLDGRSAGDDLRGGEMDEALEDGSEPDVLGRLADQTLATHGSGPRHLSEDPALVAATFARFADERVAPWAQDVHRRNRDVPEDLIGALAEMGAFGMSVPTAYGGYQESPDPMSMVVATEELSRGSLMAGSLLTRPEILVTALLGGGTESQKRRWLPAIARGSQMVAVSVTEPDHGSDVAGITTTASPCSDGYVLNGAKTWATFAGRAELLTVLARTDPDRDAGARGLSLFVIEKPAFAGQHFEMTDPSGGRLEGRAIDTLGYRGLHSFELTFQDWPVPAAGLLGERDGEGRGFSLQMAGFAAGRLQTAARALGVSEAALGEGLSHARRRYVFGRPLVEHQLTRFRLARMAARIQAGRRLTYRAVERMGSSEGHAEAAMAKALTARAAEEITRDAMQLHGGYGYAEDYPVSRLYVDARVLSIFEGAEEVLAIRVIARDLIRRASGQA